MNYKKISMYLLLLIIIITGIIYVIGSVSVLTSDLAEQEIGDQIDRDKVKKNNSYGEGQLSEETIDILEEDNEPDFYEGEFELPIEGAAGYTSIDLPLFISANWETEVLEQLEAGTPFTILSEENNMWQIETAEISGWIEHKYALINLPDIIPSIVYDNTNSYASVFRSSYIEIPNLTNKSLYQAIDYNERLEQETFIMPILYATAKKVNAAQQNALAKGEGLIIYETFRPFETQQLIVDSLSAFASTNKEVQEGLNKEPWNQTWFIITDGISNHQIGAAMDVSLVTIHSIKNKVVGDYLVQVVAGYDELEMQTPMHELSVASVIFNKKIPSRAEEELLAEPLNELVTEASSRLQQYARQAGFTPIASEWWHFNDLDAVESLGEESGTGEFFITHTLNQKPLLSSE